MGEKVIPLYGVENTSPVWGLPLSLNSLNFTIVFTPNLWPENHQVSTYNLRLKEQLKL